MDSDLILSLIKSIPNILNDFCDGVSMADIAVNYGVDRMVIEEIIRLELRGC